MIRWFRVIEQHKDSITLKLQATPACAGCPKNCNKPLFRLFGGHDNQITIGRHSDTVNITNPDRLFDHIHTAEQMVGLQIDDNSLLFSALKLYGLPLLLVLVLMMMAAGMSHWMSWNLELASFVGFVLGIWLAFILLQSKLLSQYLKISPKVTILKGMGTSVS